MHPLLFIFSPDILHALNQSGRTGQRGWWRHCRNYFCKYTLCVMVSVGPSPEIGSGFSSRGFIQDGRQFFPEVGHLDV